VQPGHADRVLDGVGAAVGEEDLVQVAGVRSAISRAASERASTANAGANVVIRAACSWIAATTFGCW
jgi:hypothetical protein